MYFFGTINIGFIVRCSNMLQIGWSSQVPKFITKHYSLVDLTGEKKLALKIERRKNKS